MDAIAYYHVINQVDITGFKHWNLSCKADFLSSHVCGAMEEAVLMGLQSELTEQPERGSED